MIKKPLPIFAIMLLILLPVGCQRASCGAEKIEIPPEFAHISFEMAAISEDGDNVIFQGASDEENLAAEYSRSQKEFKQLASFVSEKEEIYSNLAYAKDNKSIFAVAGAEGSFFASDNEPETKEDFREELLKSKTNLYAIDTESNESRIIAIRDEVFEQLVDYLFWEAPESYLARGIPLLDIQVSDNGGRIVLSISRNALEAAGLHSSYGTVAVLSISDNKVDNMQLLEVADAKEAYEAKHFTVVLSGNGEKLICEEEIFDLVSQERSPLEARAIPVSADHSGEAYAAEQIKFNSTGNKSVKSSIHFTGKTGEKAIFLASSSDYSSHYPQISSDGRKVAFQEKPKETTNPKENVFLRVPATGETISLYDEDLMGEYDEIYLREGLISPAYNQPGSLISSDGSTVGITARKGTGKVSETAFFLCSLK